MHPTASSSAAAAEALALLLREDPRLTELNMTSFGEPDSKEFSLISPNEEAAFAYAASLMHEDAPEWMSPSPAMDDNATGGANVQSRAQEALAEVDRKLAMVSGLAERLVRDNPEGVSETLLKLHGFHLSGAESSISIPRGSNVNNSNHQEQKVGENEETASSSQTTSLLGMRDKADRLHRQADMLDGVAGRVEGTLEKHYQKLESTTTRLQRVLALSSTLKMAMRLQFENKKIMGCGGLLQDLLSSSASARTGSMLDVDLRDLTRAASSVATMEKLLADPDLYGSEDGREKVEIVEAMRPEVEKAALAVRKLAASLLAEQQSLHGASTSTSRLGGILQIYFHLNELPQAVWSAVSSSLSAAEKAAAQCFNPKRMGLLREEAKKEAKDALEAEQLEQHLKAPSSGGDSAVMAQRKKKQTEQQLERLIKKKLKDKRTDLAHQWASAVGEATQQISTLQRVLALKSDPVSRQSFLQVVATSGDLPEQFVPAQMYLEEHEIGAKSNMHILQLFWTQLSLSLGNRLSRLLRYEAGRLKSEVAALYPALRAATLNMLSELGEDVQKDRIDDDAGSGGILGGSSLLDQALGCDLSWSRNHRLSSKATVDPSVQPTRISADSWTVDPYYTKGREEPDAETSISDRIKSTLSMGASRGSSSSSLLRFEWKVFMGEYGGSAPIGLSDLEAAFVETSSQRLCATLSLLFTQDHAPSMVGMDVATDGMARFSTVPTLPSLPTRYDLAKIETLIREELALADPRQGGGEFGMIKVLSDNVVDMIVQFCAAAQDATSGGALNVTSDAVGDTYLRSDDWGATDALTHDVKLAGVMSALSQAVRNAPEATFLAPYRPAQTAQHEEAARLCKMALVPALGAMEGLVKKSILTPLCRALNKRLSKAFSKMHLGAYMEDSSHEGSFVQSHLAVLYDRIAANHLSKLPSEFGTKVAHTVGAYSMYAFVSNVALVRPLGEMGRLKITQDLADLELSLEQLVRATGSMGGNFAGGASSLSQIDGGKPYLELRAVRSMLFWNGLDDKSKVPQDIAMDLLHEDWMKDVRPSTVLHFLFSLAPDLLSSPHHSKRMSAQDYVNTLVKYDGTVEDGEANAWMTTMACCDAYQQRETVEGIASTGSGDRRIAAILMALGSELLRRRRH